MSVEDAETVVQLTEEKVRHYVLKFERIPGREFRSYVKAVARSQINDLHRKRDRADRCLLEDAFDNVFEECVLIEAANAVRNSRHFSPESWTIFDLRFKQSLSPQEIAARIGVSRSNVYKILKRILKAIDQELDE